MILTVTMNPSIDIAYQIPRLVLDGVNRPEETHKTPGGKGLNVTRVLSEFGEDVTATGLIAGRNGDYLQEELDKAGIRTAFFRVEGNTRNCIAVLHEGMQTEILEAGPEISPADYSRFCTYFAETVRKADAVVFSGSLPKGIPDTCYAEMTKVCRQNGIPIILDCSGKALEASLKAEVKPTAIKPNTDELGQILKREVPRDPEALTEALSEEPFEGIGWIIVSLGGDGCFARHGSHFYKVDIPKIHVVSPVGSGDSTVAGIASGIVNGLSDEELLKRANTLGMLNAMEKQTGHVNMEHYNELFQKITVTEVHKK